MLAFFWLDNQFEVIFSPCDSLVLRLFNDFFSAATVRPTLYRIRLEDGLEWRLVMVLEGGGGRCLCQCSNKGSCLQKQTRSRTAGNLDEFRTGYFPETSLQW
jgi:hypothetical protein